MQQFSAIAAVPDTALNRSVVTIGNFDGVHRGHQALLARTVADARELDAAAVAITFWPHPQAVLTGTPPPLIATLEQRLAWIAATGIDIAVVQAFDTAFSQLDPPAFLRLIQQYLRPQRLVLGHDFRFGHRGRGTIDTAREFLQASGIDVDEVGAVTVGDTIVSSSRIRHALAAGDVRFAAKLLGRPWQIWGHATPGAGRGRTLGYPTVNVATQNDLLIRDGVYGGVLARADGSRFVAAVSIGTNPTFGQEPRHAEAFLLDYRSPSVEGSFCLELHSYLRDQIAYSDAAQLIAQIEADVDQIRRQAEAEGWLAP